MPRALTIQRSIIPVADRVRHLERMRGKRDYYRGKSCRFWVFEESGVPGAFLEFIEADSADHLTAAHAVAPDAPIDAARVYLEVEIS